MTSIFWLQSFDGLDLPKYKQKSQPWPKKVEERYDRTIGGYYDHNGTNVAEIKKDKITMKAIIVSDSGGTAESKLQALLAKRGVYGTLTLGWKVAANQTMSARLSEIVPKSSEDAIDHVEISMTWTTTQDWA